MLEPTASIEARRRWLDRFDRLIAADAANLIEIVCAELGKPDHEVVAAELLPLRAAIRWHRRMLPGLLRATPVEGRPWWLLGQRHWEVRVPLGRVAIIATWNYPLQLLGIQLVQAIAAGNRVVVKPSERSPRSQRRLLELAVAAGLPDGSLSWVEASREAGRVLLETERFDHVVFTGSTRVGGEIAAAAARSLTPTTLELSGRDSAFVLADADPQLAARVLWQAVEMNGGQTCMAPRRILVERSAMPGFLAALAPLASAARPRRLIDEASASRVWSVVAESLAAGGRTLSGAVEPPRGAWMRPVAVVHADPRSPLVEGDHFGPAVAVVEVASIEEALEIHERVDQHLATSVFTRRPRSISPWFSRLRASTVTINDCLLPTAHPAVSIGGHRRSGWGVSRGRAGMLAMTRTVTCSTTSLRLRVPPEAPAPTPLRWLRRLASRGGLGVKVPDLAPFPEPARESGERRDHRPDPMRPLAAAHEHPWSEPR
ncbi:MAG: aldehyde dehydrogenase family protein [Phycisphaerales bacterium]